MTLDEIKQLIEFIKGQELMNSSWNRTASRSASRAAATTITWRPLPHDARGVADR